MEILTSSLSTRFSNWKNKKESVRRDICLRYISHKKLSLFHLKNNTPLLFVRYLDQEPLYTSVHLIHSTIPQDSQDIFLWLHIKKNYSNFPLKAETYKQNFHLNFQNSWRCFKPLLPEFSTWVQNNLMS